MLLATGFGVSLAPGRLHEHSQSIPGRLAKEAVNLALTYCSRSVRVLLLLWLKILSSDAQGCPTLLDVPQTLWQLLC